LDLGEAANHPHNIARKNFVEIDGYVQPAPAPKFSVTTAQPGQVVPAGNDTDSILSKLGYSEKKIRKMRDEGAI